MEFLTHFIKTVKKHWTSRTRFRNSDTGTGVLIITRVALHFLKKVNLHIEASFRPARALLGMILFCDVPARHRTLMG